MREFNDINEELNRIKALMLNETTIQKSDVSDIKRHIKKSKEILSNLGISDSTQENIIPLKILMNTNFELGFYVKNPVFMKKKDKKELIYKAGEGITDNRFSFKEDIRGRTGFYYEFSKNYWVFMALTEESYNKIKETNGINTDGGIYTVRFYYSEDGLKTIKQLFTDTTSHSTREKEINISTSGPLKTINKIKITSIDTKKLSWGGSKSMKKISFKNWALDRQNINMKAVIQLTKPLMNNIYDLDDIKKLLNNTNDKAKPIDVIVKRGNNNLVDIEVYGHLVIKLPIKITDEYVLGTPIKNVTITYKSTDYSGQTISIPKINQ